MIKLFVQFLLYTEIVLLLFSFLLCFPGMTGVRVASSRQQNRTKLELNVPKQRWATMYERSWKLICSLWNVKGNTTAFDEVKVFSQYLSNVEKPRLI